MDDWRNTFPADADDARRRLECFAAALNACAQTWQIADVEDLGHRADAVRDDVEARAWFERVLAFEIERCRGDAAGDGVQLAMLDMIEQLLRGPRRSGEGPRATGNLGTWEPPPSP